MPKVSIIVPVYNVEKYLNRCIQSLLNQTLKDIEIIMVDDGSPDRCPQMCDNYAKKDNRIKVIHKQNAGLGYARNSGLEIATGEYIAFVDSDDFVNSQMYETLYNNAVSTKADVVYSGFRKEFNKNRFLNVRECNIRTEYNKNDMSKLILDFIAAPPYHKKEYIHDMSVWHSVYRHNIIKDYHLRFTSERDYASEDIIFQIDFLNCCTKVVFIPNILYYYCYNQTSLTKSFTIKKFDKIKALYNILFEKSKTIDQYGMRAKRLFIGYSRVMINLITNSSLTKKEKINYIKIIVEDNIWNDFRKKYLPSFLPIHQRLMTFFIYRKKVQMIYLYSKLLNLKHLY